MLIAGAPHWLGAQILHGIISLRNKLVQPWLFVARYLVPALNASDPVSHLGMGGFAYLSWEQD